MDDPFQPQQRRMVDLSSITPDDIFKNSPAKKFFGSGGGFGSSRAGDDLKRYRKHYPGLKDDPNKNENWKFYSGEMKSRPDGDFIDEIHVKWWGDYGKLEVHHGYIQWLFPIREEGMNWDSQALQLHELQKIKENPCCIKRLLKSYDLMLDFYGVYVADTETGELARSKNFEDRYRNLRTHSHNFLRITRILKCLGEIGFEHYKRTFLDHFISEIWESKLLHDCASSCRDYWIGTCRIRSDRKALKEKISRLSGHQFHQSSSDDEPEPVQPITTVVVPPSALDDSSEEESNEGLKTQFGVIVMEDKEAVVEVPPVFGDTTNFTYLLTPVGQYADLYVKKPMKDLSFIIAIHGDFKSPLKVNWEIATTTCYNYDDFFTPEDNDEEGSSSEEGNTSGKSVVFGEIMIEGAETEVEIPPHSFGQNVSKFVYHLTPIGGFASLFVSAPLKHDRFTISRVEESGKPLKVHWEVHVATQ